MAFILNFLIGISFTIKVPIFLDTKDPTFCQAVSTNGIVGRGRTMAHCLWQWVKRSQSYLQLGWKFQLCWNVTFWLILVTWEPFRGPLICLLKKSIQTHYILLKKSSWDPGKLWGWIFWRLEDLKGYLEVPWGNFVERPKAMSSAGDQTQYYLKSSSSKQGCYCYCFFPFAKE